MELKPAYAALFPGQGSQSIGMLDAWADYSQLIEDTFAEVSTVVGEDLWDIAKQGPQEKIDATVYTQPIMLAADVALWRCWQTSYQHFTPPHYMAGHSLGEYSALVCAEALSLTDASGLVKKRAQLMQEATAPGEGAMAAVLGLDDDTLVALCLDHSQGQVLSVANYNCIGQCVVAGDSEAVKRLMEAAKKAGAKLVKEIAVSVPSHCALMESVLQPFSEALQQVEMHTPKTPVIQNVDVSIHSDTDEIKKALLQQLTHSVRWVETIQWLAQKGVMQLLESGPGGVLTKLNKRILKEMKVVSLKTPQALQDAS